LKGRLRINSIRFTYYLFGEWDVLHCAIALMLDTILLLNPFPLNDNSTIFGNHGLFISLIPVHIEWTAEEVAERVSYYH
jgi:hypothetical protein